MSLAMRLVSLPYIVTIHQSSATWHVHPPIRCHMKLPSINQVPHDITIHQSGTTWHHHPPIKCIWHHHPPIRCHMTSPSTNQVTHDITIHQSGATWNHHPPITCHMISHSTSQVPHDIITHQSGARQFEFLDPLNPHNLTESSFNPRHKTLVFCHGYLESSQVWSVLQSHATWHHHPPIK